MDNPSRWQQRFVHFERAYGQFVTIIEIGGPDKLTDIEKMALIQAFEFTFELAWKTLKDYLENIEGYDVTGPRIVLRQAFQSELIREGEVWLEALKVRNETAHTYNEVVMDRTIAFIYTHFFPLVRDWYYAFKREANP